MRNGTITLHSNRIEWFFAEVLSNGDSEVLDFADINEAIYAAIRIKSTGTVYGCICSYFYLNSEEDNFYFRIYNESEYPVYTRCPIEILDLLSAPANENASFWRESCIKNSLERRLFPVAENSVYRLLNPIRLNGVLYRHILKSKGFNRWLPLVKLGEMAAACAM